MSYQICSGWPCRAASCYIFNAAIVVPCPPFAAAHVEDVDKLRANGCEQRLKVWNDDPSAFKMRPDGYDQVRQPGRNYLQRKTCRQIRNRKVQCLQEGFVLRSRNR